MENNSSNKFVDIDQIFKSKNSSLYKILPRFLLNYLKNIVHQDEINYIITTYDKYKGINFVNKLVEHFNVTTEVSGLENLPANKKRYVFVSNHPLGGFDGILFIQLIEKYVGPSKSVVNDLLMNIKNLEPFFIGVNKHGLTAKEKIKLLDDAYASDSQMLIFPAGLVSRKQKGIVKDLDWQKSFISKAVRHERDVIPIRISGNLSSFFYNLANLRKFLKIKSNIEMLYLSHETFKLKQKHIKMKIGKPIPFQTFDKTKTHFEWAQWVKEKVYDIEF